MGSGLADGLGVCDGVSDGVPDGVSDGVPDGVPDGLAEGLALVLPEALTVPLEKIVGVGEVVPAGENEDDPAEGVDPEQAESAAEASMVMLPQPMTVNIALSPVPAMVVRTFMEPPHASRQVAALFPGPKHQNRHRKGKRVAIR